MTKELPPTMVHPDFRSIIYNNYGTSLSQTREYSGALDAFHAALKIERTLANHHSAKHKPYLTGTLMNIGLTLYSLGRYDDAVSAYEEALKICMAMLAEEPTQFKDLTAKVLYSLGDALLKLNRVSEAARVEMQAVSFLRSATQTGESTKLLCNALHNYGRTCYLLGKHADAVRAYRESISLRHSLAATDPGQEKYLIMAHHNIAISLYASRQYDEANTEAIKALQGNRGRALAGCDYAPNFHSCPVCQKVAIGPTRAPTPQPIVDIVTTSVPRKRETFLGGLFGGNGV